PAACNAATGTVVATAIWVATTRILLRFSIGNTRICIGHLKRACAVRRAHFVSLLVHAIESPTENPQSPEGTNATRQRSGGNPLAVAEERAVSARKLHERATRASIFQGMDYKGHLIARVHAVLIPPFALQGFGAGAFDAPNILSAFWVRDENPNIAV